jgi:hypothetical protein
VSATQGRWLLLLALLATGLGLVWANGRYPIALADPDALAAQVRAGGAIAPLLLVALLGAGLGELPGWLGVGIALGAIGSIAFFFVFVRRTAQLSSRAVAGPPG